MFYDAGYRASPNATGRMFCGRLLISPHPVAAHHSTSSSATLNSRQPRFSRGLPRPEVRGLRHSRGQTSGKEWWGAEVPEELGKQGNLKAKAQSKWGIRGSWGWGIPAIPHLCRTRLVQRGHNLWTIRAWPSVASEFLPAPTVCSPPRHPIEESSKEQNIRVPYRQLRGPEAPACPCESGIERFRPRAGAPDVCRLSA